MNRDTHIENRFVDTTGEGEGDELREEDWYIYTIMCKIVASGNLLYSAGTSARCSVMTEKGGKETQEGGDIRTLIADSRCCTAETNTTLESNYTLIKNK